MHFINLTIKNFKQYSDNEISINLNINGSKLIVGQNGSGKTTIVDALLWCLYGKTFGSVEDVVNWKTKKNCKVSSNFIINTVPYTIYRYRKHDTHNNKLMLFKGEENISLKNATDTQNLIDDIIKIPYYAMIASMVFSSELYGSFLRSTPADRLKIFDSILNLREVNELYDKTKEKNSTTSKEKNIIISKKENLENNITNITNTISSYEDSVKSKLIILKQSKTNLSSELSIINQNIEKYISINIDEELGKLVENKNIEIYNSGIGNEIRILNANLVDIKSIKIDLDMYGNKLREINFTDIEKEIKAIENNKKIEEQIKCLQDKVEVEEINNSFLEQIKEIEKENLVLTSNKCSKCGQIIDKEKTAALIQENSKKLLLLYQKIEEGSTKNKLIRENNKKISSQINLLNKDVVKSNCNMEQLNVLKVNKNVIEEKVATLKSKLEEGTEKNKSLEEEIEQKQKLFKNIYKVEYTEKELYEIKNYNKIKEDIENKITSLNDQAKNLYDKNFIDKNKKVVETYKKELSEIERSLNEISEKNTYYDLLMQIFSNKNSGFKKFIIDKIIEAFNDKINFYLPFFFDKNISVNFNKDLIEEIVYGDNKINFSSFSSGQKTRLELTVAFSLFTIIKIFFSADINLLIFDEILDMNLDTFGVNSVLNIIENLSMENLIFIISHREEYKDKFDNKIEIKVDNNGYSYIEGE